MKRTVVLDKNAGSKKLRDACNEADVVRCILLPRDIHDQSDDVVLAFAMNNSYLMLTFDKPLFFQNAHQLAGSNPGLLLIKEDESSIRRINTKTGAVMLKTFKSEFADWNSVPWRNSYVEITPTLIHVYCTSSVPPERTDLKRVEHGWQDQLKALLQHNSDTLPGPAENGVE